jgi:hypothetical protein
MDKLSELESLRENILDYVYLVNLRLGKKSLTRAQQDQMAMLYEGIGRQVGHCARLITDLTGLKTVDLNGKDYDMWVVALRIPINKAAFSGLTFCLQVIDRAIGQLEEDIKCGVRDITGRLVDGQRAIVSEPPKAFIAHEGETQALTSLKNFLEALGVRYFIVEAEASDGKSVEKHVNWIEEQGDFAIILATKGKAIDKRTGKHYMGLNVADELGSARQIYGNRIILLVQKGVQVHTNKKEIVYGEFTSTNMQEAFIKIARELKNWSFLKVEKVGSSA